MLFISKTDTETNGSPLRSWPDFLTESYGFVSSSGGNSHLTEESSTNDLSTFAFAFQPYFLLFVCFEVKFLRVSMWVICMVGL